MTTLLKARYCAAVAFCAANFAAAAAIGQETATSVAPLEQTSVGEFKALLYHAERNIAPNDELTPMIASLIGTGEFGAADIDVASLFSGLPAGKALTDYDCVYVWASFNNYPTLLRGNELADYVDAGGGVILSYGAISDTDIADLSIQGRITDPTYSPLDATAVNLAAGVRNLDFTSADISHPILDGVGEFSYSVNGAFSAVTLDVAGGAYLIANDTGGIPAIAISEQGDVAAFNVSFRPSLSPSAGVIRAFANACGAVAAIWADIDIKPDSFDNEINLTSNGVVPVAIYGSEFLDVWEIDTDTLTLADSGVKVVGKKNKELCTIEDLDLDGYEDLVCKFNTTDLGALDGASTKAKLKGNLTSGRRIRGSDMVNIVKE
jgi:hypothetical protein